VRLHSQLAQVANDSQRSHLLRARSTDAGTLAEFDRFKDAGAVNDTEYEVQRQKIIGSI
jgi:hypothetical protein